VLAVIIVLYRVLGEEAYARWVGRQGEPEIPMREVPPRPKYPWIST
jgi:hypothetical protein